MIYIKIVLFSCTFHVCNPKYLFLFLMGVDIQSFTPNRISCFYHVSDATNGLVQFLRKTLHCPRGPFFQMQYSLHSILR